MGYAVWSVVFGEQPSASKWNLLGTNDASFNDGSGIGTNAIAAASLATSAITLGYAQITTSFSTATGGNQAVTGLSAAVTIPAGGRRVKITSFTGNLSNNTNNTANLLTLWDGTVGSGTQLAESNRSQPGGISVSAQSNMVMAVVTPAAGSKTYNVGVLTSGGTISVAASTTSPAFILVEAI